ncbi:MAG: FHA domain-containing protein [Enhydrobacter sp.]|nr:MAG: FHA domain-containing protein [Enhydrobacter sp.]
MGLEIGALLGFLGLTSAFALVGTILAAWMAWRIVEKAGLPGWAGMAAVLLTLTAVATIVPLILLWVFAFMRWPRDDAQPVPIGAAAPTPPASTQAALAPPRQALADRRGWRLTGAGMALVVDGAASTYLLTGAPAVADAELSIPDPSVGRPHARLLCSAGRLGLEDLGTPGGTWIDGARLLPEHGPRDITAARTIRLGSVELALSRA